MIAPLLLLAQIALAPPQPEPTGTSIAALRADPKKFNGQIVRLHGWVNHCNLSGCRIEEHPATFPGGAGESLSIAADPKFDATVKPLLPTYVELDARVDSGCLGAAAACSDGAPGLTVIKLRGVIDPREPPPED